MAVYSIGELACRAERRAKRTYEPVRRGSREKGTFETEWYRRPQPGQYGLMCDGVRLVDEQIKRENPGSKSGPMGLPGEKLIRAMHSALDYMTGRLDVSFIWLCEKTGYSRPTVSKALDALERYGFIERQRRCVRTAVEPGEPGPRWRQATNVYRLKLPAIARRLLGLRAEATPLPADQVDHHRRHSQAAEAMLKALPADEIGDALTTDKALAKALNRMGRHFVSFTSECELNGLPQSSPSKLIEPKKEIKNRTEGPVSAVVESESETSIPQNIATMCSLTPRFAAEAASSNGGVKYRAFVIGSGRFPNRRGLNQR